MVRVGAWQTAQPMVSNSSEPLRASGVEARRASRGGALVARMKRANRARRQPGMTFGAPDFVPTHCTEYVHAVGSVCSTLTVASSPVGVNCPERAMR